MQKKLGNGADTYFWDDLWRGDMVLKQRYPRLYALELNKKVDVASKLSQESWLRSFRRAPRSGVEQSHLIDLMAYMEGVVLGASPDRWYWALEGSGDFLVTSVRKVIDESRPMGRDKTKRMGSTSVARSASSVAAVDALLSKFTQCAAPLFFGKNNIVKMIQYDQKKIGYKLSEILTTRTLILVSKPI
ncbi:hypothetical protein Tco_0958193 [Tanacetum coccineum]